MFFYQSKKFVFIFANYQYSKMSAQKIKVIITGATGMVGEGTLHVSLQHPSIENVLVINRTPCEVAHPKLTEIIHNNFFDLSSIEEQLTGYDACFFAWAYRRSE